MEQPMLQVPLEIAFHNIESSDRAEQEIRTRVADLERLYGRLTFCRVRVDQRAKDVTGTIPPVVHIELGIPGRGELVVRARASAAQVPAPRPAQGDQRGVPHRRAPTARPQAHLLQFERVDVR
jgi:hypothetical protein